MLVLATAVFGLSFFTTALLLVPFLLVLFLFGIALGILASALVLRLGPPSEWFVWPIPALLSPFAGVFYPLSTLPAWMQWRRPAAAAVLCVRRHARGGRRRRASGRRAGRWRLLAAALRGLLLACWVFTRSIATRCAPA